MDPKAANVQSVPIVQSVYNAQEQELNEVLRALNLESLLLRVKNVLDLDFLLEGVYAFLGVLCFR